MGALTLFIPFLQYELLDSLFKNSAASNLTLS